MSATVPYHLAFFLSNSHVQSWGRPWSGNIGTEWMKPDLYVSVARELERGCFDYILLEDNVYIPDAGGGNMEIYLKNGLSVPRRDPMMVAPYMLQATQHIGIVPTVSTFSMHPYLLARQLGSMDQLSGGRAGWNIVTGSSDRAVQNFGEPAMMEHDLRYDHAAEFTDLANALWDSWAPDSVIADHETGVLADPAKVHTVDFEGKWFKSRGPLNSGPAPQGRPVVAQAGGSKRGREFAAKYADTIVVEATKLDYARDYRNEVRALAETYGRNPDDIKLMLLCAPIIAESEAESEEKLRLAREHSLATAEHTLAIMSKMTSINFNGLPLDEPLVGGENLKTNGTQRVLVDFIEANEGKTLRQAAADLWVPDLRWVGTPDRIADNMQEAMDYVGGDGFLFASYITRRYIAELVDGLVPVLQRRGLSRTHYSGKTLRENLLAF